MDDLTKEIHDLQEAINCIRKTVTNHQVQMTGDLADFKRDQAEKFMTLKYAQAEQQQESVYKLRQELALASADIKKEYLGAVTSNKTEFLDSITHTRELIETKLAGKIKSIFVSSAILLLLITILSTLVIDTREAVETVKDRTTSEVSSFKENITTQLNNFKQDMRAEFGAQLESIRSIQQETNTLLRVHIGKTEPDDFRKTHSQ